MHVSARFERFQHSRRCKTNIQQIPASTQAHGQPLYVYGNFLRFTMDKMTPKETVVVRLISGCPIRKFERVIFNSTVSARTLTFALFHNANFGPAGAMVARQTSIVISGGCMFESCVG